MVATGSLFDLVEKPASDPRPLSRRVDPELDNDEFITSAACRDDADDLGSIETHIDVSVAYRCFKPWVGAGDRSVVQFFDVGRKSIPHEAIDRYMLGQTSLCKT